MAQGNYKGIFLAPKLQPMEFGLFSAASVNTHSTGDDSDSLWVRGFSQDFESRPNLVANVGIKNSTVDTVKSEAGASRFAEIKPFFVEVEDYASTMGMLGLDRRERVLRQIEGVTQKAVEKEFWEGTITRGDSLANPYLRGASCTVLSGGTAVAPHVALALLEFYMGQTSTAGEQGFIHMTRDVASVLGGYWSLVRYELPDGSIQLQTDNGTAVVIGAGYTGNGPYSEGSNATASDTVKWIYATGIPIVHLGESEVVNDNLAQAYDVTANQNNMKFKAIRPVAAYFDTSIHLAVKVDLTKTAG